MRTGSRYRLVVLALCSVSFCAGQIWYTPAAPAAARANQGTNKHYSVSGSVINAITGEPIRRALVQASGPEQHAALTGADGRFQMESVPEGPAYFSAQKPGFFAENAVPGIRPAPPKPIAVGAATPEVQLKLIPEAKIHGRVVDSDGQPIEGLGIQLMSEQVVNGRKQLQANAGAVTNANGEYHMDGLMAGKYKVRSALQPVFSQFVPVTVELQNVPDEVFSREYFPDATDADSAQDFDLKSGQEAEADFKLTPVSAFKVSGIIAAFQENTNITCLDSDGDQIAVGQRIDQKTGKFVLSHIPTGSYTMAAWRQDGANNTYYAEQPITVGTSDVDGVRLLLQPTVSIPVNFSGVPEGATPQIQVRLFSKQKRLNFGQFFTAQRVGSPQAPLTIPSVPPGLYTVSAQAFGNSCIESVSSGNLDLLREDLTVSAGSQPQPIDVTLRTDCSSLSGTVHSDDQNPAGMAVLVPNEGFVEPKVAIIQPNGTFSFVGLSPGRYQVYAFSNIVGLEYANPEPMRSFDDQDVTLEPNQKAQIDLKLNIRGPN